MVFDLSAKQKIQDKFAHYLKSYRRRKDLTQAELAKRLDYAESHIRKFEGRQADNRMTRALEFMRTIAALEDLDLISFLAYLEGRADADATHRQLYPWELTVLASLQAVDLTTRRQFVAGYLANEKNTERVSKVLRLAAKIGNLPNADLALVEQLVLRFGERTSHPQDNTDDSQK